MDFDITVCFTTNPKSFFSKLVRWITRSKVSHSMWCLYDHFRQCKVIFSADDDGFVSYTLERFLKRNVIVVELKPVGPDIEQSLRETVNKYLGTDFDFGAAGLIAIKNRLKLIWKWFGRKLRKVASPRKLMCSESITRPLQIAGYEAVSNLDPETASAEVVMQACLDRMDEFKVVQMNL